MRVLFVEDDDAIRELYISVLIQNFKHIEVVECGGGFEAIELISGGEKFDLIISDYSMPGGTGGDLYSWLRERSHNIPFLLCTTYQLEELSEFVFLKEDNPGNGYMQKPIPPSFFRKELENKLGLVAGDGTLEIIEVEYRAIKTRHFYKFKKPPCDVFLKSGKEKFVKIMNHDESYSIGDLQDWVEKSEGSFFLEKNDFDSFAEIIIGGPSDISEKCSDPVISMQAQMFVKEVINDIGVTESVIRTIDTISQNIMDNLKEDRNDIFKLISNLKGRDNYLYNHSLALSYMCGSVLENFSWGTPETLEKIIFASLIHDTLIEEPMLCDSSRVMNRKELVEKYGKKNVDNYFKHPVLTAELIIKDKKAMFDVALIVKQHHERPDGSGFPNALKEEQISPLSAVFIVCHQFLETYLKTDHPPMEIVASIRRTLPENVTRKFLRPLEALEESIRSRGKNAA